MSKSLSSLLCIHSVAHSTALMVNFGWGVLEKCLNAYRPKPSILIFVDYGGAEPPPYKTVSAGGKSLRDGFSSDGLTDLRAAV